MPEGAVIGVSTATVEEARKAEADGAYYIAVGAIYPTTSKAVTRPAGLVTLESVSGAVSTPVVAIGGINADNVGPVVEAGADSVCVISAVLISATDIEAAARELEFEKINAASSRGRHARMRGPSPVSNLGPIIDKVRASLSEKHGAREEGPRGSRDAIRHCANSIRATHRGEFEEAERLLAQARELLDRAEESLAGHPSVYHAGFLHDAQKEYAEGQITLALASESPLPDPDELRVGYPAYLNGMGEAVGEMRRHILDTLRKGDIDLCERKLEQIDAIYTALTTIDFPDGITSGLRRTTDMVRRSG